MSIQLGIVSPNGEFVSVACTNDEHCQLLSESTLSNEFRQRKFDSSQFDRLE
jgi:hypothetical protein